MLGEGGGWGWRALGRVREWESGEDPWGMKYNKQKKIEGREGGLSIDTRKVALRMVLGMELEFVPDRG